MNYIVFDLEWNQSTARKMHEYELRFEIIEIGAVKCDDKIRQISQFEELVKPQVFHEMHRITGQLIHVEMKELEKGSTFVQAMEKFQDWCGREEYRYCTWGCMDLTELQKNMKYYGMEPLSDGPIPFLDIQKLFSIAYEDGKSRKTLEYAVDFLQIPKDIPFHRAFSDAYYTAKVLGVIKREKPEVLLHISFDVFHPPVNRKKEIRIQFDTYVKYISREFESKEKALADREVSSSKCYYCHCNLKKKINWFALNKQNYYCLAYCSKHGFLKGKIRMRKTDEGKIYAVKTTKFISAQEADAIEKRRDHVQEMRRKHRQKRDGTAHTAMAALTTHTTHM